MVRTNLQKCLPVGLPVCIKLIEQNFQFCAVCFYQYIFKIQFGVSVSCPFESRNFHFNYH